MLALHILS